MTDDAGAIVLTPWDDAPHGLTDARWADCETIELRLARTGGRPIQATSVQFAESPGILWARFRCEATQIRATMIRYKDKVWTEGAVEIYVQPAGESSLYEFQLSPIGTFRDLRVLAPGGTGQYFDDSWNCEDAKIEAAIHRDRRGDICGWSGMFGIPWKSMATTNETTGSHGALVGAFRLEYQPEEFTTSRSHPDADPHDRRFLRPVIRPPG